MNDLSATGICAFKRLCHRCASARVKGALRPGFKQSFSIVFQTFSPLPLAPPYVATINHPLIISSPSSSSAPNIAVVASPTRAACCCCCCCRRRRCCCSCCCHQRACRAHSRMQWQSCDSAVHSFCPSVMPRRLLQLKAVLSFLSGALCDGAISRLGESAFVFLLSWCDAA